jgi:SAM-dependent methyltransferase
MAMEDVSTLVARLYEGHPYPPPRRDIGEAIAQGGYQVGDPALWAPMLWPEGRPRQELDILVAGCGTTQAAWFAYTNRDCDVTGVDLSESSLAHQRYLQERHDLKNLRLLKGDLRDAGDIGKRFDVIVCTGVLHHMEAPEEGVRALAGVLTEDGVLAGMVYAAVRRTGVHMLQALFRKLDLGPDAGGIAFARRVIAALPSWHFANFYIAGSNELDHDTGFADTFLHPQDRAFTVPQVLALIEDNGLFFQGWFENALYYLEAAPSLPADVLARLKQMALRDQWAAVELLLQWPYWHFFFARKQPPLTISFAADDWRSLVPHQHPGVRRAENGQFTRLGQPIELSADEAALFIAVDGAKPLDALGAEARALFERLWKQGHVMISKPQASSSTSQ